jgi:hypothetical protein
MALQKDAPIRRAVQRIADVVAIPVLGGLHHRYIRIFWKGQRARL